jgi:small subunit ribosomal protein S14
MAKKSVIHRNKKRIELSNRHRQLREELKAKAIDPKVSDEEQFAARMKLQKLPRNGSPTRVRNRCQITGRPRGVYRKFMISRIVLREYAHLGYIPGMTKASW